MQGVDIVGSVLSFSCKSSVALTMHTIAQRRFARHRRLVAFVLPGLLAHIIWWSYMASDPSKLQLFTDVTGVKETPNWYMCITMTFGSMIAGATSEVRRCGEVETSCVHSDISAQ